MGGREMLTISDLNCQDKKLVVYYCKWWEARFQSNGLIDPLVMLSTLEWTPPFHSHLVLTLPLVTLERWSLVVSPFHNNKYRVHEREVLKNSFLLPNTHWTINKISQQAISTTSCKSRHKNSKNNIFIWGLYFVYWYSETTQRKLLKTRCVKEDSFPAPGTDGDVGAGGFIVRRNITVLWWNNTTIIIIMIIDQILTVEVIIQWPGLKRYVVIVSGEYLLFIELIYLPPALTSSQVLEMFVVPGRGHLILGGIIIPWTSNNISRVSNIKRCWDIPIFVNVSDIFSFVC